MAKEKKKESRGSTVGGLVFVGALMIGLGVGLYFGNPATGVLIGLGVGFILFGVVRLTVKD